MSITVRGQSHIDAAWRDEWRRWLARQSPAARADALERYAERAAIMEFDGCLTRAEAERLAADGVMGGG